MSPRTGRPLSESPKNIKLQIRVDKETSDELDECAKKENVTRSDIVRKGIKLVKAEQETKK